MPGQNYSALLIKTGTNTWSLDNGAPALVSADVTTALGFVPWSTTGTTTVTTPTVTQTLAGSGTTKLLTVTAAAHTGQAASTELTDIDYDLKAIATFLAGALTLNRSFLIQPRTFAFASASTITDAYTLYIGTLANTSGAPIPGTNATITNRYAFGAKTNTSSFAISHTLANFSKFGGTGLVIQNGSIVLSNSAADPTLTNTIQVGTVSNVSSITSAGSNTPITYASNSHSQTSGTTIPHNFTTSVGPTSGTGVFHYMRISGATNQTGGSNGNVTILSLEPTWTAAGGTPTGIDYNPTGTPTGHRGIVIRPAGAVNGFGTSTPSSKVHIGAGTTAANTGQIKLDDGVDPTAAENGLINRVASNLHFTADGTVYTLAKTLTATATLNFDLTAVNYQDLTITVTGAAEGDAVSIGVPNGAVVADVTYFGWVSAANTVSIRCSRVGGGGAADPASGTFRASVIKY